MSRRVCSSTGARRRARSSSSPSARGSTWPSPTPTRTPPRTSRCCVGRASGRGQPGCDAGQGGPVRALGGAPLRPPGPAAEGGGGAGRGRGGRRRRVRGDRLARPAPARARGQGPLNRLKLRTAWRPPTIAVPRSSAGNARRSARRPSATPRSRRMSGEPIKPLYTEADLPADPGDGPIGLPGRVSVHPRGVRLDVPRAAVDDAPVRRVRRPPRRPTSASATCSITARPASRPRSTCRSLMGYDSDHPRSLGEVGREGVAVDSLEDMETLFRGIPLDQVTVSMTINAPAAIMLAFYVVAAERQGVADRALGGTIQTDILKEYIAQKEWCFPVDPAMRLVGDMIEWCAEHMPRWHPSRSAATTSARPARPRSRSSRSPSKDGLDLRRAGGGARPRRRRLRAPAELLLQRAHRLLRGDRQVPRRPADLGARAARDVRRAQARAPG